MLCLSELQGINLSAFQPKDTAGFPDTYILAILICYPFFLCSKTDHENCYCLKDRKVNLCWTTLPL